MHKYYLCPWCKERQPVAPQDTSETARLNNSLWLPYTLGMPQQICLRIPNDIRLPRAYTAYALAALRAYQRRRLPNTTPSAKPLSPKEKGCPR